MPRLTRAEAKRLRTRNNWSLQQLANISGINKAYLSEFETGQRTLSPEQLDLLQAGLLQTELAGTAAPKLTYERGHYRLTFVDPKTGKERSRPAVAHVIWTEDDGRKYSMYVGEP